MEVQGHLTLFLLAAVAMYGMLADKKSHHLARLVVALPIVAALWFGLGGVLTTAVGYSLSAQLFLGIRLYLAWQHMDKDRH